MRPRIALTLLTASAVLAAAATPAAADTTLATGLPDTVRVSMSPDGATLAWSAPTADGRWKLVLHRGGVTQDAAVRTASAPFDVDLGTDGAGRLVATYSRCASRSPLSCPRGCDPYVYEVTARTERRIPGLGRGDNSDYLPTASFGRVAFARSVDGARANLLRRGLDGGTLQRMPGGLQNRDRRTGPRALDLGRRGLAVAWVTRGPAGDDFPYGVQEARYDALRGGHRLMARYVQGNVSGTDVVGVNAIDTGSGMLWGAQGNGEDERSRLYLVPVQWESSDSRSLGLPLASASGTGLDRAVVLTCPRGEAQDACSVVLLGG
jgi:hypothetical protein